jgi:serine/threonine-protein kinase
MVGGRYRIVRLLGAGGMGTVYEALQVDLNRRVALKVLQRSADPVFVERFRREAQAAAGLGHPNVVAVTDFQTPPDGPPFLVMELLQGESLASAIARAGKLPPARVAYVMIQVLAALEAAHRAGIIHRDIKPDNVFLIQTPAASDVVKVLDFGIAKVESADAAPLTVVGVAMGTVAYASPEQSLARRLDHRTDIYAVGATMYHALTGRVPGDSTNAPTAGAPASLAMVRPLVDVEPGLPRRFAEIVDRAMAWDPADRFATATEMRAALAPFVPATSSPALSPAPAPMAPRMVSTQAPTLAPEEVRAAARPATVLVQAPRPRKADQGVPSWPFAILGAMIVVSLVIFVVAAFALSGAARQEVAQTSPTATPPPVPTPLTMSAPALDASTPTPTSTSPRDVRPILQKPDAGAPAALSDASAPSLDGGVTWRWSSFAYAQGAEVPVNYTLNARVREQIAIKSNTIVACFTHLAGGKETKRSYYYAIQDDKLVLRAIRTRDNAALDGCITNLLNHASLGPPPHANPWPPEVDVEISWAPRL